MPHLPVIIPGANILKNKGIRKPISNRKGQQATEVSEFQNKALGYKFCETLDLLCVTP